MDVGLVSMFLAGRQNLNFFAQVDLFHQRFLLAFETQCGLEYKFIYILVARGGTF